MKNVLRNFLYFGLLSAASTAFAASSPTVDVIVKEKAGKVAFQGKTGAGGKFATATLPAGSYTFEFTAKDGSAFQVALAGAKSTRQSKKNPKSGQAFDVEVAPASKVSGQVTAAAATAANAKSNAGVKIINGKRYVWARGELGSHMGGKWVPEEEATAVGKGDGRGSAEMLRSIQDMGNQGAASGR